MSERELPIDREELKRNQIDIAYRDFCSHLLVPLNKCRREHGFAMWQCDHERHAYEKCQYEEYKKSVAAAKAEK
eukprot:CAMPEP_0171484632 /NCGR_PEP_ID=MMETSP0958-20121227/108_1 /TAXON_ID=87120 /ORGANISM="Aurantiochytrium limacinum, Strain ATCCMYA-1381" /LENGTH=73 /DNA_ID=CAMNT_0012017353 /DNA_START=57 /DNA_END=278 /DNA_ORIENTATION=-